MKYLYKYPQAAYPYADLIHRNRENGRSQPEYELLDTGVFDDDRYFDVFVEYAKASPEDLLIQITVHNRGPEPATLQVLPTLWFRNDWVWGDEVARPNLQQVFMNETGGIVGLTHRELGERFFYAAKASELLFTENETNTQRLWGVHNPTPYVKDGIGNFIVHSDQGALNPEKTGTKVAAFYPLTVGAGKSRTVRLRLNDQPLKDPKNAIDELCGDAFESVLKTRLEEADEFYASVIPASLSVDEAWSCGRLWRGCCGPNSSFIMMSVAGSKNMASSHTKPTRVPSAMTVGVTWSTRISSQCRISGNIHGMLPGTWPSTSRR